MTSGIAETQEQGFQVLGSNTAGERVPSAMAMAMVGVPTWEVTLVAMVVHKHLNRTAGVRGTRV